MTWAVFLQMRIPRQLESFGELGKPDEVGQPGGLRGFGEFGQLSEPSEQHDNV